MDQVGDIMETIRPWLSVGLLTGIAALLGLILRHQINLKRVKIEADHVDVEVRKVNVGDEADIRDHYAQEVAQLREALHSQSERHRIAMEAKDDRHRRAVESLETKLKSCETGHDQQRDQINALKDLVAALRRIITQASASQAIRIAGTEPGEIPADIVAAAERVEEVFALRDATAESDKPE